MEIWQGGGHDVIESCQELQIDPLFQLCKCTMSVLFCFLSYLSAFIVARGGVCLSLFWDRRLPGNSQSQLSAKADPCHPFITEQRAVYWSIYKKKEEIQNDWNTWAQVRSNAICHSFFFFKKERILQLTWQSRLDRPSLIKVIRKVSWDVNINKKRIFRTGVRNWRWEKN